MAEDGHSRRYLITGGAGFIGSHLTDELLARGSEVTAVDDLSTGRAENLGALGKRRSLRLIEADAGDEELLDLEVARADQVVHLAAAVGVGLIVEQPVRSIETNLLLTERVLRAARRYGRRVFLASSSEVYGKRAETPFSESDDVVLGSSDRSRWSYAAAKMTGEFLAMAYHKEHGLPVTIGRFFNTVGPRQTGRYGMVVPRFVRQAIGGGPLTVYGDGAQSRCFCDVRDVVRAVVGLIEHRDAAGETFNIGGTDETTILTLAERVRRMAGGGVSIIHQPYEDAYEAGLDDVRRRVPDTRKIEALLGWTPRIPLDETLHAIFAEARAESREPLQARAG